MEAPVRRWLKRVRPWTATVLVNGIIMTLYLWHITVMVLLIGLFNLLGGFGFGLAPGSAVWWMSRPIWISLLAAGLAIFIVIFSRFERTIKGAATTPLPAWQAITGAVGVCGGLSILALNGIGAEGVLGIRIWTLCLVLAGTMVVLKTGPITHSGIKT